MARVAGTAPTVHATTASTLLALAALLALPGGARAQDAHYWTQQYGPRAGLLGGAIIGSTDDYSAVFYNPGGLSLVDDPGFALSTQIFERESITLEDGAGPGVDLGTSRSGLEPSLIAGRLPWGGESHTWAYALLSRNRVDTDVGVSLVRTGDATLDPNVETSAGTFRLENRVRESWAGFTWAYRASERLGVGVSTFGSWRQQDSRSEAVAQALDTGGSGAALVELNGLDYRVLRLLWKVGVSWQPDPQVSLGATLTTPGLQLYGSSQVGFNRGSFGLEEPDALEAALRDGQETRYRSPLSVGMGGAWTLGATRIHLSGEWFDAVGRYDVITAPGGGAEQDTLDLAVVHEAVSVVNWGVGVEHRFNARIQGFASVVTDRSAAPQDPGPLQVGTAPWDIVIASLGADFVVNQVSVTLGLGYGFGGADFRRVLDLLDQPDVEDDGTTHLRYRNWRFIFGFEL